MKIQVIVVIVLLGIICFCSPISSAPTCTHPTCNIPKGQLKRVTLEIGYTTLPGTNRQSLCFNGTIPGPLIEVNENDEVEITVINHLDVPTTIHWHGIYQYHTNYYDGVPGITQCLIPPNISFPYRFAATPAGTMFYHSHYDNQIVDGLFGPLVIHRNGGDLDADEITKDLVLSMSDYYNYTSSQILGTYLTKNNPDGVLPIPDALLVNGKFDNQLVLQVEENDFIRLRFINSGAITFYNISVDYMTMEVVAVDGVEVTPYKQAYIYLNVAQRVDVHLNFTQLNVNELPNNSKAIYIRINAMVPMYAVDISNHFQPSPPYPPNLKCQLNPSITAIFSFDTDQTKPTYTVQPPFNQDANIPKEHNTLNLRPVDSYPAPDADHFLDLTVNFHDADDGIFYAFVNNISFSFSKFSYPTELSIQQQKLSDPSYLKHLNQVLESPNITIYDSYLSIYALPDNAVVEIKLINHNNGYHPFHLHAHDFWIVSTSEYPEAETDFFPNYLRRDVLTVPGYGWVKIRFVSENPGMVIFHCHLDWHLDAGLATLFLEAPSSFQDFTIPKEVNQLCNDYRNWLGSSPSSFSSSFSSSTSSSLALPSLLLMIVILFF